MIYVDSREFELIKLLARMRVIHEVIRLEVGDIIVGNFIIELKKGCDLVGSIFDSRLFFQNVKMNATGMIPVLILYDLKNMYSGLSNRNVVNGVMASFVLAGNIVVPVENLEDLVYLIKKLEYKSSGKEKQKKEIISWSFPKFKNNEERRIAALTCGLNIGYKKGKELIEEYKSIKGVIQNIDLISSIKGFGPKLQENVKVFLTGSEKE